MARAVLIGCLVGVFVIRMSNKRHKSPIIDVDETTFDVEVLQSKTPVLVAFRAAWSQPCHILDSVLDDVAATCGGNLKVVNINTDDNPYLSLWYEIRRVPTLLFFTRGRIRADMIGTVSKQAVLAKFHSITEAKPNNSAPGT